MAKGIVYICSTAIPGLIKIGKTSSDEYETRMKTLKDNGYRNCTGLKRHELGSEACVLSKDIICSSVSEAAYYVCGHGMNGWVAWKDKEGDSIQIYRKK